MIPVMYDRNFKLNFFSDVTIFDRLFEAQILTGYLKVGDNSYVF